MEFPAPLRISHTHVNGEPLSIPRHANGFLYDVNGLFGHLFWADEHLHFAKADSIRVGEPIVTFTLDAGQYLVLAEWDRVFAHLQILDLKAGKAVRKFEDTPDEIVSFTPPAEWEHVFSDAGPHVAAFCRYLVFGFEVWYCVGPDGPA